jgi:hypothetical protein
MIYLPEKERSMTGEVVKLTKEEVAVSKQIVEKVAAVVAMGATMTGHIYEAALLLTTHLIFPREYGNEYPHTDHLVELKMRVIAEEIKGLFPGKTGNEIVTSVAHIVLTSYPRD